MITGKDIYDVLSALVPLYVAMILAYGSVRWWRILTPDQCAGISRFVSAFAIPLLSFHFISSNDPYAMNLRFIAADCLEKVVVLFALLLWHVLTKRGGMDWSITLFSLSTLPNTLVMGIPLLKAMYGGFSTSLMTQIVVLQSIIWYTLLIALYECRAAMTLVSVQLPPDVVGSVASFEVEPGVGSLSRREYLQTDTIIGEDGKVRVVIRRSDSLSRSKALASSVANPNNTIAYSNGVEICSLPSSSRGATPSALSFEEANFRQLSSRKVMSLRSEYAPTLKEDGFKGIMGSRSKSVGSTHMIMSSHLQEEHSRKGLGISTSGGSPAKEKLNSELHTIDVLKEHLTEAPPVGLALAEAANKDEGVHEIGDHSMPPTIAMTRLVAVVVWRKLIRNPNTYASIIGLIWSLISFRLNVKLPKIIDGSISILSNTGLGMATFSLGLFMALQPKIITCGNRLALFSMAFRFLVGPLVSAGASAIVGLRGDLLRVSILQASLPQAIVTFVFAKEYDCHADILSTAVIFGMVVALPITIIYFVILGLV